MENERTYIYLDDERDRQQFIAALRRSRQDVLAVIDRLPEDDLYAPRYHGWTPAAMLAHLNMMDSVHMFLIRAALVGFRSRLSTRFLDRLNGLCANMFRRRLLASSRQSVLKNQQRIADLVMKLPVDKFSTPVYSPQEQETLTVERAIQAFFLYHWQHHLETMREVEGIQPQRRDRT